MTASRVLVLNSGSSSVKYQLLDMADRSRLAVGLVERIGEETSRLVHERITGGSTPDAAGGKRERLGPITDHDAALKAVAAELAADGMGLDSPELAAVGHRVVHGGTGFTRPTVIDDEVLAEIRNLIPLAPLHNPANVTGIEVARSLRADLPQVAVFDTAFHSTMPEYVARYAIDAATADAYSIRRYGFHGTSHAYVSPATALPRLRLPGDGRAAGQAGGGRERDRPAPGQRRLRLGRPRRRVRGDLHGPDPAGGAGHGNPFGRPRPGGRLPPGAGGRFLGG